MSTLEQQIPCAAALKAFTERHVDRSQWVAETLEFNPIVGDAGFRQYFRLNTRVPMLAVWAPPETENSVQFCKVSKFLLDHGVRAPRVLGLDLEQGFLIVEDLGGSLLQDELNEASVDGYYSEAMTMLLHMQAAKVSPEERAIFPAYSEALLRDEMSLFDHWYLGELLGIELSAAEKTMLAGLYDRLIARALAQQQAVVHRDFHSRNLLVQGNGGLATIDFQDAVWGPITYDLVSLLKDCYVVWPAEKVDRWAKAFASMAQAAGVAELQSEASFIQDFHWMGLQRHIKVLGIFSRLYLRDGKERYLADLPQVLSYVLESVNAYSEFSEFASFMQARVLPKVSAYQAAN